MTAPARLHAIIAGGGIAGLTTAIALSRIGFRITVLEQADTFAEVGAGLQLSPNGTRILDDLGVLPLLQAAAFEPEAIEMRLGGSGRRLLRLPMGQAARARWGAPYLQVYRPDLITALLQRLQQCGDVELNTSTTVLSYQQNTRRVSASLSNGNTLDADLLIGADGIHSRVRAQMHGASDPVFTGNVAWRCVVPEAALGSRRPPPVGCIWAGPGKHAVTTWLRGGSLLNFVGIVEQDEWIDEGWQVQGTHDEALRDFDQWSPVLTDVIRASTSLYRWALCTRPSLASWSQQRVVILGDAAHAMLPSMAQGAVQAIEDAQVLAVALGDVAIATKKTAVTHREATPDPVAEACRRFYQLRHARVERVQGVSAANLRLFHQRTVLQQLLRYTPVYVAGKLSPALVQRRNDWLYGYRVQALEDWPEA